MGLAENLRRLRLERYWSQADLGKAAGVHKATIMRIERGGYVPQLRTIRALADALGVPPTELATPDELAPPAKTAA
jgi:transcriptional regulator with XRE-family HTH domain